MIDEQHTPDTPGTTGSLDGLRLQVQVLEATIAAMRPIVLRVAEARMCRDLVTMTESCPHCSLQRNSQLGYAGAHEPDCIVTQARALEY